MATLVSNQGSTAVFESTGKGEKTKDIESNAQKSLFHQLFYKGVDGINDGKPLVVKENQMYTNSFFNETARYALYVVPNSVTATGKPIKVGSSKMVAYRMTVRVQQLINDMKRNNVYTEDDLQRLDATQVREEENVVLPTVIVVPFKRDGENYARILQNDYDRRIAVSSVQDGFESRNITTVDLHDRDEFLDIQYNLESPNYWEFEINSGHLPACYHIAWYTTSVPGVVTSYNLRFVFRPINFSLCALVCYL